ncbi:hypothetical protein KCP69_04565 [Salmonella enterica subsp. enterica]|nr:hypothetical protein KCP69_04565 [Salmonella enterica subsp. enterica]
MKQYSPLDPHHRTDQLATGGSSESRKTDSRRRPMWRAITARETRLTTREFPDSQLLPRPPIARCGIIALAALAPVMVDASMHGRFYRQTPVEAYSRCTAEQRYTGNGSGVKAVQNAEKPAKCCA